MRRGVCGLILAVAGFAAAAVQGLVGGLSVVVQNLVAGLAGFAAVVAGSAAARFAAAPEPQAARGLP